nr:YqgE/AlgH family protein [Skermania piniformis]
MAQDEQADDGSRRPDFRERYGDAVAAAEQVRPGSLLIAATELTEPTFRRTVIYIIEHNDGGSLGVVINRPSEIPVGRVLPRWATLSRPTSLYVGGPVKRDAALCLAVLRVGAECDSRVGLRRVAGRVAIADLDADPRRLAPFVEGARIFVGYSGWTFGQLESELERGDWMVLSARAGDLLVDPRVDLWAAVLRRQPMPLALLATHPIEVERN